MLPYLSLSRRWKQWLVLPAGALLLTVVACEKTSYTGALPEPKVPAAPTTVAAPAPVAEQDKIYAYVEHMPEYPGGMPKLFEDIKANSRYPDAALEAGLEGRVFVGFVVERDGSVSGVRLQHGIQETGTQAAAAKSLNDEALRVVSNLPGHWTPGKQGDKAMRVSFVLPVQFAK